METALGGGGGLSRGESAAKTSRGEQTRARILDAALKLFREQGYEEATMRAIAEEAGVSVGNAYYYFASKEHLIQEFYLRTHVAHAEACEDIFSSTRVLEERLRGVLRAKIETAEPYHRLSGVLFRSAADPRSPLSPFASESEPIRAQAIDLMRRVVDGSTARIHADIRAELPEMLWMYEMSIILFWIHDNSDGRERTLLLIDRTVDLVARLVKMASLPLIGGLRKDVVDLLRELRQPNLPAE